MIVKLSDGTELQVKYFLEEVDHIFPRINLENQLYAVTERGIYELNRNHIISIFYKEENK